MFYRQLFIPAVLILLSTFILNSCSASKEVEGSEKEYQVNIIISNAAGGINPVHIVAKLDNWMRFRKDSSISLADDDLYSYMGARGIHLNYSLQEGSYRIFAEAGKDNAVLDVSFVLDRPLWLLVYYLGENHFRLEILHRQPVFG